ncbi:hypothetical protein CFOL_v3_13221 [Cephalotus follicularis]|uniref:Secreted protein n=1 Tax=Cephalotus follicularis TaxID=3775 RepID=A0A1Q3BNY4_CEPFO|nr:hypothetical protein CFOL_v3_13221 [Cephalotus follicularis]
MRFSYCSLVVVGCLMLTSFKKSKSIKAISKTYGSIKMKSTNLAIKLMRSTTCGTSLKFTTVNPKNRTNPNRCLHLHNQITPYCNKSNEDCHKEERHPYDSSSTVTKNKA